MPNSTTGFYKVLFHFLYHIIKCNNHNLWPYVRSHLIEKLNSASEDGRRHFTTSYQLSGFYLSPNRSKEIGSRPFIQPLLIYNTYYAEKRIPLIAFLLKKIRTPTFMKIQILYIQRIINLNNNLLRRIIMNNNKSSKKYWTLQKAILAKGNICILVIISSKCQLLQV